MTLRYIIHTYNVHKQPRSNICVFAALFPLKGLKACWVQDVDFLLPIFS